MALSRIGQRSEGKRESELLAGYFPPRTTGVLCEQFTTTRRTAMSPPAKMLGAEQGFDCGAGGGVAAMKKLAAIAAIAIGAVVLPHSSEAGGRAGWGWGGWDGWCGCCYYGGYYRAYADYYRPCYGAHWGYSRRAARRAYRQSQ
jgi:hypothetical protein